MLRECPRCYELVVIEDDLTCTECGAIIEGEEEERDEWWGMHMEE